MAELTRSEARVMAQLVRRFAERFRAEVVTVLEREVRGCVPAEVNELLGQLALLERQLDSKEKPVRVHDANEPLLKRVLLAERRAAAQAVDVPLQKAIDPQLIRMLKREIDQLEHYMSGAWFAPAVPQRVPSLTDYLSIRHAEAALADALTLAPRDYDEKFHILEAPALFLPDLAYYRRRCGFRGAPIAVAYLDIDDFKAFNTKHTETRVDLDLLAPFMEAIEAHVFAHGHAYRFGGDEYVLTLPNMPLAWAGDFLRRLQARIANVRYRAIQRAPTISIGLVVLDPDCPLTDREALARANAAKNFAKTSEKGRIAAFAEGSYRETDLALLPAQER